MIAIDRLLLVSIDESLMAAGPFLGMVLQSGITVVITALVLIWSTRAENPDFFRKELPLVAWSLACGVIGLSCICLLFSGSE